MINSKGEKNQCVENEDTAQENNEDSLGGEHAHLVEKHVESHLKASVKSILTNLDIFGELVTLLNAEWDSPKVGQRDESKSHKANNDTLIANYTQLCIWYDIINTTSSGNEKYCNSVRGKRKRPGMDDI